MVADDLNNSGVFKLIQMTSRRNKLGEGNEINGLTLGGVGTGTEIHHVEVVANVDEELNSLESGSSRKSLYLGIST